MSQRTYGIIDTGADECAVPEEVSDPIAVSRWDQKEPSLCALCDSAVNLVSIKAQIN